MFINGYWRSVAVQVATEPEINHVTELYCGHWSGVGLHFYKGHVIESRSAKTVTSLLTYIVRVSWSAYTFQLWSYLSFFEFQKVFFSLSWVLGIFFLQFRSYGSHHFNCIVFFNCFHFLLVLKCHEDF